MPTVVLTFPDVATTVIVELVELVPEAAAPDPPHALSEARPITLTSTKNNSLERLRLFIPAKHSSAAKAESGKTGRLPRRAIVFDAATEIVRLVLCEPLAVRVTVDGVNVQLAFAGRFWQKNDTFPEKFFPAVTITSVDPEEPALMAIGWPACGLETTMSVTGCPLGPIHPEGSLGILFEVLQRVTLSSTCTPVKPGKYGPRRIRV